MKPTREKTNFESLRRTPSGELDLSGDWGGGNTKFMLYGRDKEDDFFIPIGILEKPMKILKQYPITNRQCADYILSRDNLIKGLPAKFPYSLIPYSRLGVEHGITPEKVRN
ncbi:MAG: hypothetical protein AABW91_02485 [Nanoarchaeota archaeon]